MKRFFPIMCVVTGLAGGIGVTGFSSAMAQERPDSDTGSPGGIAVLNGLDKISARISTLEAPIGEPVQFGTLFITVRRCHQRPPEEPPETTVYLEVQEIDRRTGELKALFDGWMFASSPGVSSLEHPVYDVWAVSCKIPGPDVSAGRE